MLAVAAMRHEIKQGPDQGRRSGVNALVEQLRVGMLTAVFLKPSTLMSCDCLPE